MSDIDDTFSVDLDIDVTALDTSRPVLKAGDMELTITAVEIKPNKAETGANAKITFQTVRSQKSITGDEIKSGYKLFKYLPLQPNPEKLHEEGYDQQGFLKDLTIFMDAANGIKDAANRQRITVENLKATVNRKVLASVGVGKDQSGNNQNEVNIRSMKPAIE